MRATQLKKIMKLCCQSEWPFFKFTESHTYVAGEIVTWDLGECPVFMKGVIEVHAIVVFIIYGIKVE